MSELDQGSTPSTQTSSEQQPAQADRAPSLNQPSTPQAPSGSSPADASMREKIARLAEKNRASQTPPGVVPPTGAPAPQALTYTPNYKFKVSNQEKEMDDWIRGAVKDPETEKKVRELYEKAYGLDVIKPRYLEERESKKQIQAQFATIQRDYEARIKPIEQAFAKGDLQTAFKKLNLPDEKVFQYAWNRLQYLEQPQEHRSALESAQAAEERAQELEQKYQSLELQTHQHAAHARAADLSSVLEKPEIKSIAENFNARMGERGMKNPDGSPVTFYSEVIKRGQLAYYTQGIDLPVHQAVSEVLSLLGNPSSPQAQPGPQALADASGNLETPAPPQAAPAPREKPPVIPVVQGKPQSPATRAVRSVEDLKRIRKEKFGS